MIVFIWKADAVDTLGGDETKNADSHFFEDETEAKGFIHSTAPSNWPDIVLQEHYGDWFEVAVAVMGNNIDFSTDLRAELEDSK